MTTETVTSDPQTTDAEKQGCPQCGSTEDWGAASWCPNCGFYPAMGLLGDAPSSKEDEDLYEHWWEVVPGWVWPFAAGVIGIAVGSVAVRVYFADSPIRGLWTLCQFGLGMVTFAIAHLVAYLYGCCHNEKLGPMDIVIKPIETWKPAFAALPDTLRLVCSGGWGLSAAMLAVSVIGGVDYNEFFVPSNEFLQKYKANLLQRTVSAASEMAGQNQMPEMDMEEALNQFAEDGTAAINQWSTETGSQVLPEGDSGETGEGAIAPEDRPLLECVVFGYTTNNEGDLRSLFLAGLVAPNRLQFVSKLSIDNVPEDVLEAMKARFRELATWRPLVNCPYNGRWLKPEIFCMVAYEGWTIQGWMKEPEVIPRSELIETGLPSFIEQAPEEESSEAGVETP